MTSEKTTEKAGDKTYIIFLKTLHELCCPLDTPLHPNVPVVRGPELHTALEVYSHQCQVQGRNNSSGPAAHTTVDSGQDTIALVGHLGTL